MTEERKTEILARLTFDELCRGAESSSLIQGSEIVYDGSNPNSPPSGLSPKHVYLTVQGDAELSYAKRKFEVILKEVSLEAKETA